MSGSVTELFSDADDAFFERINSEHVLQPFLSQETWSVIYPQRKYSQSIVDNKNYLSYRVDFN